MAAIEPPARPAPPSLPVLVDRLERVLEPLGWEQAPVAVGVEPDADVVLLVPPEPADDPIGAMVGLEAPAAWIAFGVVASGRVHDLVDEGGRRAARRRPTERRARFGHFVDRDGRSTSYVRLLGERPRVERGSTAGRVDDVCRRVLGLATPPPAFPVEHLWAVRWLERLAGRAEVAPGDVSSWGRVAACHVACPPGPGRPSVGDLIRAGRVQARRSPWEVQRVDAAAGRRRFAGVSPAAAAWMDAGMFSRWVLMDAPPLSLLRAVVAAAVPADVAAAVDEALDGWGLP
ncbi:MAG: hypothetical protein KDB10_14500 [Acidimicrobiales bacterium]|nr:hypothetical protein [Acidimicrobiales bacterium]MCB9373513.1 hypothetical protein [Microthrixaceae bacterium]